MTKGKNNTNKIDTPIWVQLIATIGAIIIALIGVWQIFLVSRPEESIPNTPVPILPIAINTLIPTLTPMPTNTSESYDTILNRGIDYHNQENYDLAIDEYTKAISIEPDRSWAYEWRGIAYNRIAQYANAIDDFSRVIQLAPTADDIWKTYFNRGLAYYELEKYTLSVLDFDEVLKTQPVDAGSFCYRGQSYEKLGNVQEAINDYQKCLSLLGQNPDTFYVELATNGLARLGIQP